MSVVTNYSNQLIRSGGEVGRKYTDYDDEVLSLTPETVIDWIKKDPFYNYVYLSIVNPVILGVIKAIPQLANTTIQVKKMCLDYEYDDCLYWYCGQCMKIDGGMHCWQHTNFKKSSCINKYCGEMDPREDYVCPISVDEKNQIGVIQIKDIDTILFKMIMRFMEKSRRVDEIHKKSYIKAICFMSLWRDMKHEARQFLVGCDESLECFLGLKGCLLQIIKRDLVNPNIDATDSHLKLAYSVPPIDQYSRKSISFNLLNNPKYFELCFAYDPDLTLIHCSIGILKYEYSDDMIFDKFKSFMISYYKNCTDAKLIAKTYVIYSRLCGVYNQLKHKKNCVDWMY